MTGNYVTLRGTRHLFDYTSPLLRARSLHDTGRVASIVRRVQAHAIRTGGDMTEEHANRLFDAFFIIKQTSGGTRGDAVAHTAASVTLAFPPQCTRDFPVDQLPAFCFPAAPSIPGVATSHGAASQHVFAVTQRNGRRRHAVCRSTVALRGGASGLGRLDDERSSRACLCFVSRE